MLRSLNRYLASKLGGKSDQKEKRLEKEWTAPLIDAPSYFVCFVKTKEELKGRVSLL